MSSKYKQDIIRLRKQGKSYREIENELECSKGTIAYHCKQEGLEDIGMKNDPLSEKKKEAIRNHYKNHKAQKTAEKFNVAESTIRKHSEKKNKSAESFDEEEAKNSQLFANGATETYSGNHKQGQIAEEIVAAEAMKRGYNVCEPLLECRYDFILDNGVETKKVQVKSTKQKRNGSYILKLTSKCRNSSPEKRYTKTEIDAVIGYIFEEDLFVHISPEIFEKRNQVRLRYEDADIEHSSINRLEDYLW